MKVGIYYRVSTDKQTFTSQMDVVEAWVTQHYPDAEVIRYRDKVSGKTMDRAGHKQMMADAVSGKIKAVVVYKLDRFSRSMMDALNGIKLLGDNGCAFHSVTQSILDTSQANPFSGLIIAIFGTLAQMERESIVERVKAGLKASTKKPGRKFSIPQEIRDSIKEQYAAGRSLRMIAEDTGVSVARVHVITKE